MILYACKVLGYQTTDCVYVGDQPTDMEAAKKADVMVSLGVRNTELSKSSDEFLELIRDIQII